MKVKLYREYGIWFVVKGNGVSLFWNSKDALASILKERTND